jgi:hypothetical protein
VSSVVVALVTEGVSPRGSTVTVKVRVVMSTPPLRMPPVSWAVTVIVAVP